MTSTNIADFRQNLSGFLEQVIHGQVISVTLEQGNAIVLNGEEYQNIMETLRLTAHPQTAREVLAGMREDWNDAEVYNPEEDW